MNETFDKGIAFVFEGDTEKYFYVNLLQFICSKYEGFSFEEKDDVVGGTYVIEGNEKSIIVRINTVGTITQMVHSGNWFNNTCASKYSSKMPWDVFLCYDTDSHTGDISKFQENDWKRLRENISRRKNIHVFDMAASAEIEDVFLMDLENISIYLNAPNVLSETDIPYGRTGKAKLRSLFRSFGKTYHEGKRALDLINVLDKQKLIDSGILPLVQIETSITK